MSTLPETRWPKGVGEISRLNYQAQFDELMWNLCKCKDKSEKQKCGKAKVNHGKIYYDIWAIKPKDGARFILTS